MKKLTIKKTITSLILSLGLCTTLTTYADTSKSEDPVYAEDLSILYPAQQGIKGISNQLRVLDMIGKEISVVHYAGKQHSNFSNSEVVSVRLDPCFLETVASTCQAQMRVIFQAFRAQRFDAALHVFFNLTQEEFQTLLVSLKEIRKTHLPRSTNPELLGVHRGLKQLGTGSAYANALQNILTSYMVSERISRVTSMGFEDVSGARWEFNAAHVDPITRRLAILDVPNLTAQNHSTTPFRLFEFARDNRNDGNPWTLTESINLGSGEGLQLFNTTAMTSANESKFVAQKDILARIENPNIHSQATMDCFSCHSTHVSRAFVKSVYGFTYDKSSFDYQSTVQGNTLDAFKDPENVHAFSYYIDQANRPHVSISDRTRNETDVIWKKLNNLLN